MIDEGKTVKRGVWEFIKKTMLNTIDDDIEFAESQWNKAHQRGDDRSIEEYESRLTELRGRRKQLVETIDQKIDEGMTYGELSRLMEEVKAEGKRN